MCEQGQSSCNGFFCFIWRKTFCAGAFLYIFLFAAGLALPSGALAQCPDCCCVAAEHNATREHLQAEHDTTRQHIIDQFENHRQWWRDVFFNRYIGRAMFRMTEQLSAGAMQQMEIVGAFLDAKHQLETQALLQELEARAYRDYSPSVEMCNVGTIARSLAATNRRGEYNAVVLAQRLQDRQLMNQNSVASNSIDTDKASRMEQFKDVFCDIRDNNNGLEDLCGTSGPPARRNKDIDYTRTISRPLTLDVAFDVAAGTDDEEDVFALASNLYAHDLFRPIPADLLGEEDSQGQMAYLDVRSVVAKRSVAENSFNAIVGLKSRSAVDDAANPYDYMASMLEELGVTDPDERETILGEYPSYYAQMEFLTKKIYQRPGFYVNLYDKPANLGRKAAAMRAVSLIQNMDMFDSRLRTEAMLATLLELKIMDVQEDVQNRIVRMRGVGKLR